MDSIAAHCDGYSSRCSRTMRTARSRTSAENWFDLFTAPFPQESRSFHQTRDGSGRHRLSRHRRGGDSRVKTYSETTLLSEKLRAILQQETRGRSRKQDIYDIHFLLTNHGADPDRKERVLRLLVEKAHSRGLVIDRHSMAALEILERSKREYDQLQQMIEGDLPHFEGAFATVRNYYESLPWD
ncbi:MAG: hypothetical protein CBARDMAM_6201 [uncultured Caballeronia sp.]|nr:MAG: hypothetical protein CBARDMAM_6201 [uncultured Caballeronia sp.]